jgi:hypothetical protein
LLLTSVLRTAYVAEADAGQDIQARLEERIRIVKSPERLDLLAGTPLKSWNSRGD